MSTTVRSRSSLVLAVAAALGVLLAGCDSADDAAPASASPTAPAPTSAAVAGGAVTSGASGSGTTCGYDAADTFVVATSAELQGSSVVVTADPAQFVCGGANNGHFETDPDTTTLQLAPSATIRLLAGSGPDLEPAPVPPAELPARLADEPGGVLFQVTGPASAVTALTELYRP
jgi:hypothetical protein